MAYWIRMPLLLAWVAFSSLVYWFICLARWGDLSLSRDIGRMYAWGGFKILGIRRELEGAEHLEANQPCIYTCNHQSGFDLISFGSVCPRKTVSIGKKELVWVPFFGLVFLASGNVIIDRKNRSKAIKGLDQVVEATRNRGASIIIFPEGTRNAGGEMLPFKKGAFYMAIAAGVPIVPIVCANLKPLLDWKGRKLRTGVLRMRALPPVPTTGLTQDDVDALSAKVRAQMTAAIQELSARGIS